MPVLYIANCTRQITRVMYRLDYDKTGEPDPRRQSQLPRHQDIPSGRQLPLGGDLHMVQIDDILQQLAPYGLVAQMDLAKDHGRITWVSNVGKPVHEDAIRYAMDFNSGILTAEGQQRRQRAAIAANEVLSDQVQEAPQKFSVEYEEQDGDEEKTNGKKLAEGVRVDPSAPPPPKAKAPRPPALPRSLRG